ncbi:probable UDP-N-acetylglucosamine--peptide N-acetylglucosaminyltransferase SPINDLY isoform X2 [Amborella trichopoda]|uniref:probable UDP-N-acetylglucosamine--peptide N-acetylglucosaminyltransferase SPINDLY isoform X2 n=1 Tax=Amborella trichopoda TaxID=13333 RepID=UPI0009C113AB|nr:probable UDP-N-acetylglucosamine--peptide N-acetylglucosaminyltransferase SPINDLY isoform X2 [Amborella trichopoda]|eukprot:XP_020527648.1 probable UDP-N-acetylglucosamine--peptide N-acetylglucosaminyltransferase SPINDLY isoform X2 [Amborella trichopoda]
MERMDSVAEAQSKSALAPMEPQALAPSGNPRQRALQQQALHQEALHKLNLQPLVVSMASDPSIMGPRSSNPVKAEPLDEREIAEDMKWEKSENESREKVPVKREAVLADLNVDPPESDGEDFMSVDAIDQSAAPVDCVRSPNDENGRTDNTLKMKDSDMTDGESKRFSKLGKGRARLKAESPLESGHETDADQQCLGVSTSREEKIGSLKGLVHVARKMPKNAHAHFILGLMYQRLGQPQKAIIAFEKSSEILQQSEEEVSRPELLSLVQIHHAQVHMQCLLQGAVGDGLNKELEPEELDDILFKLKESVQSDVRQAAVWNTLGLILLRSGRLESAISVLSSLLFVAPDFLDSLANLGIAYLQSGDKENAAKCFQSLLLRDQNHATALVNYGALLLCQYGSLIAGPGARGSERACQPQMEAANAARVCLASAVKSDPKAGHSWVNLAHAYYMAGDHRNANKCLEQATKLEPNSMSTRYAVALHRIKDAERSQDPTQQLSWAANEMASILRDGDPSIIEPRIAWAGLAMVHRAQHEIAATFENGETDLKEMEERAFYTLEQAIEEDPNDALSWHQLGLYKLCTLQFKTAQNYFKAAVARRRDCSYAWSNLGISLQLSEDLSVAEEVYKQGLSLANPQQAHAIFSNLGNLYRQQRRFQEAHEMFEKSFELCPGYAPSYNNLGLVFVAEGKWEDAIDCFKKALAADPLLDAAKSNMMKAEAMSRVSMVNGSSEMRDKVE